MTLFPKKNIIGSFLTVILMVGGSSITLTSCFSNPEEPKMETPDDPNVETPVEPENPDDEKDPDENGDVNKPAEEFTLPEAFTYPYSYVVLPDDILIQTPEQVKEYTGFTVSFNKDNHTPNYVVWELKASETTGSVDRNDYNYWVDKDLEGCLDIDYAYNTYKYERGHMCPAADQKWSEAAMYDCMVMANMGPQYKSLNSGLWGTLENMSRTWAKRDGAIWIIAGPVYYPEDTLYIGRAKARVPSAYFKAFLYDDEENPRAIAFMFSNGSNPGNIEEYAMSIDELEEETGYDFFSALPDDVENAIEASFDFSAWNK